jgi:hypothetical protein
MTGPKLALTLWLAAGVLVLGTIAIPVLVSRGGVADPHRAMPAETVDLSALSPEIAANYRYAAGHQEHFAVVDCYCGCVEFLGHETLADCYVTADGTYEPHAAGCAVCNGEASLARSLFDDGAAPAEVARQVDDVYGTTVGTVPPPSPDRSTS